jgi:glycosyltransferase involved in cell wall biosynthesis
MPAKDAFHQARPELGGRPYVLFLSRLHYKKGLDYLADAFAICAASNQDLQLVVAGPDDGALEDFQRRIDEKNLKNRTHVVGPLYGSQKLAALRGASVFSLPSRQEGFSVAIAEAMACEIPVVVSKDCHFPEVAEVKAGVVVNLDPQEIAQAILQIVNDRRLAQEMGRAGRNLIESRFTWPKVAEQSIQAYEGVIQ